MTERLQALANALPEDIDAALITSALNRRYYTGFSSSAGGLIVTRKGCVFIIDSRYHEAAARAIEGAEVLLQGKLFEQIEEQLERFGAKRVAVESDQLTLRKFRNYDDKLPGVDLLDDDRLAELITTQRRCKSVGEIDLIRQAQRITDATFAHIVDFIKPGKTEREIALEIEFHSKRLGSEANAFDVIAVGGVNSSMPHGTPGERAVGKGDLLTMDFGCVVGGYCSDMTRTVAIGEPGEKERDVYETVLRAQAAALAQMKPGVPCKEVDRAARDLIDAGPYRGSFGHGLGHSLGLDVHEEPACNPSCEAPLEPGMLMTAEPGIYLAGEFGVRIEDLVVITADGHENLTASGKELLIL